MPTLIACLSTGKGTWAEVGKLIKAQNWDKVFLITNKFGQETFSVQGNTELIVVTPDWESASSLAQKIKQQLQGKISDFEIALNLTSGSGKEHMAVLEAVLELGLNFRLVGMNNEQLEVLGINRG